MRSPAAACRGAGPRWSAAAPGCGKTLLRAWNSSCAARWSSASRASSWPSRRPPRSWPQNVASLGFDLDAPGRAEEAGRRLRPRRAQRDRGNRRVRPRRAVRPAGPRDRLDRRQAGRAGHASRRSSPGFPNEPILRAELRRLFRWLKDKGVTAVITGERGDGTLTRHGLEEYVSDCVILLDHRVTEQISTRRLRVVKYRGSHARHQRVSLPDRRGRHLGAADHVARAAVTRSRAKRVSTGIPRLDAMLGGEGLLPRAAACSSRARPARARPASPPHFADATCRRGERCLYFAFEESPEQIIRNMRSIGSISSRWSRRDC